MRSLLDEVIRRFNTNLNIRQVAIVGFVIGVLFNACVAVAVINSGSGSQEPSRPAGTNGTAGPGVSLNTVVPVTSTRSATGDRTDCAAIRGTDYRSETERQWFMLNCR